MDLQTRKNLREALTKISTEIASALRLQLLAPGPARDRAVVLHRDEKVGDAFELWTDLLSRRAAVLWVLKSLYIRALEDRGLLRPARILDAESEQLFAHLAPNLGPTAYLRWIFRDLSTGAGGLPELFASQPAEIAVVPDALSRKLIDLWRGKDPDTGVVRYRFDDEHFDGRLLGDLYQDLDPVVKKRYALLQTPDFVLDFILDETLTPAIAEFGIETVRVLDPACGSGHFLLAAFKRLVAGMREKEPQRPVREVVRQVLDRVVGIDLNDYACGLARARLVMTALEVCGESDLAAAHDFHPRVYCADALEQVELDEQMTATAIMPVVRESIGMLTPPEVRAALREVLKPRFHAVVGNPPYITEKDASKRAYHTQKIGKTRRYVSAAGKYSLGAPFTERMLQLAAEGGFVGEITADSFMKREFGRALVQEVLARRDLRKVVSLAGARIPEHVTATVLIFARNRPPHGLTLRVVMGKRGESGKPAVPARGKVWLSILEGHATAGFESEYVSVAEVPRATMNTHPWSIGGGGAAELKQQLELGMTRLGRECDSLGFASFPGADDVFVQPREVALRLGVPSRFVRPFMPGESVRDWGHKDSSWAIAPYDDDFALVGREALGNGGQVFWRMRGAILATTDFGGTTRREQGAKEWSWYRWQADRYRVPLSIAFAFKATHNHFVLDRGGSVFNRTAPVIKLPAGATEARHLVLLAQLNSSIGDFWVKQVMQSMGAQGVGNGLHAELWDHYFERDGGKLELLPLARTEDAQLESFAHELDALARRRLADSPRNTIDGHASP
jgi:SAM-dependent methyltransferase